MIGTGLEIVMAGLRMMRMKDRSARGRHVLNHLSWLEQSALPVEYLGTLFPQVHGSAVAVTPDVAHHFELPYGERLVLAAICRWLQPRRIFEFGTFTGTTTRLLADLVPEATIETVDLPADEMVHDPWVDEVVGLAFEGPEYDHRIRQHRVNSRRLDYATLDGPWDLVFVDASHEYEDVLHDSRRALEMVSPTGLIIWDDYQPAVPGVVRALNEMREGGCPIVRIAATRLAVHRPAGLPEVEPSRPWSPAPDRGRPRRGVGAYGSPSPGGDGALPG